MNSLNKSSTDCPKIACDTEYDYVEVTTYPLIEFDNGIYPTTRIIVKKGDTATVPSVYSNSDKVMKIYGYTLTAAPDGISSSVDMTNSVLYMNATFYKYDSQ